jgi:hypothetical protein
MEIVVGLSLGCLWAAGIPFVQIRTASKTYESLMLDIDIDAGDRLPRFG